MLRRGLILWLFALLVTVVQAQTPEDDYVDFRVDQVSRADALRQLRSQTSTPIIYSEKFFDPEDHISLNISGGNAMYIVGKILDGTPIKFKYYHGAVLVYREEESHATVSGYVTDSETHERLPYATVQCYELGIGVMANEYGFYSMRLPKGTYSIVYGYVGYEPNHNLVVLEDDQMQNGVLRNMNILDEVGIRLVNPPMSMNPSHPKEMTHATQQAIPGLGGEEDYVRALHILPGVNAGVEGAAGLQIRGGGAGQNLMLLDGVPIYIPFHLMGLYSVYNSSTVKSARLHTGSYSARFGGRLSGILDVRTRDGDADSVHGEAAVNLVNGRLEVEGPFGEKTGNILVSGRWAPTGRLMHNTFNRTWFNSASGTLETHFKDILVKTAFHPGPRDGLYLSLFYATDNFEKEYSATSGGLTEEQEAELYWGNLVSSLRWNHSFGSRAFTNTTITFSRYHYQYTSLDRYSFGDTSQTSELYFLDNRSNNLDLGVRTDLDYALSTSQFVRVGAGYSIQRFAPNLTYFDQDSDELNGQDSLSRADLLTLVAEREEPVSEAFGYVEHNLEMGRKWNLRTGLRMSLFAAEDASFLNAEPRIRLTFEPNWRTMFSLSGGRLVQYQHLISNTSIRFPNDLWLPTSEGLLPATSYQVEAGARYRNRGYLTFSLEGYYKHMQGLYGVPSGFNFLDSLDLENPASFLSRGNGRAWGIEGSLLLEQREERYSGMISYTYSHAYRRFDGQNLGLEFPFDYDRRHQFKLFGNIRIVGGLQAGLTWMYLSGNPVLDLVSVNQGTGLTEAGVYAPGEKNSLRNPPFHRLDLKLSYAFRTGRWDHRFSVSVHNAYNRKNVSYYRREAALSAPVPVYSIGFVPGLAYSLGF